MSDQPQQYPKIRLLADRVLVEVIKESERKTSGGIIIPQTTSKESEQAISGKVVRVSPKVLKEATGDDEVALGMVIICSKYAGSDIQYKGKDYKVMRITDIFGVDEDVPEATN